MEKNIFKKENGKLFPSLLNPIYCAFPFIYILTFPGLLRTIFVFLRYVNRKFWPDLFLVFVLCLGPLLY